MERLQNMETVLPPQVCTKPHTLDDHRSRDEKETLPHAPFNDPPSLESRPLTEEEAGESQEPRSPAEVGVF